MTTSLPALAVALLLAACAPVELGGQTWYKEGASTAEQQAALAAAETQARQAHVQPPEERNLVLRSMTAQGWRLKPRQTAPALDSAPHQPEFRHALAPARHLQTAAPLRPGLPPAPPSPHTPARGYG